MQKLFEKQFHQTISNSLMKDIIGKTTKAASKDSLHQFLL